jgi:hypothetical protein
MRTHVGEQHSRGAQSLRLPAQTAPASDSARARLADNLRGIVGATVPADEDSSYASLPDEWLLEEPFGMAADRPPESVQPRFRAKELAAELDSINAQIHRMMFQVERAVARLATSGSIS